MEEVFLIDGPDFKMTQIQFLIRMLVSAGVGFVIGLERQHSSLDKKRSDFAGVRTFMIVVLLGFISTFLSFVLNPFVFAGTFSAVVLFVAASYWISANKGDIGGTSEVAVIISFLLGVTTCLGFIEVSLAMMVLLVVILSFKDPLKTLIKKVSEAELRAFISFVVIALLIFPFLPNKNYGPFEVINPNEIGWVVILTSGIGFGGYILMKFLGSGRGILFTGIFGGLVSSTVVTWVFSKKSKESVGLSRNCAVAILAASSIMIIRVAVLITIFNQQLLQNLIVPFILLLIAGFGITYYYFKKGDDSIENKTDVPLGNPLNLKDAFLFAVFYVAILLIVNYANDYMGDRGVILSSAIAGLTDVDAITISVSKLGLFDIPVLTAQNAILLAALCNTIVKLGIGIWLGSNPLKKYLLIGYGIIFCAGLISFLILNLGT